MADDVVAAPPTHQFVEAQKNLELALRRMVYSANSLEAPLVAFEATKNHDEAREHRRQFLVEFRRLLDLEKVWEEMSGEEAGARYDAKTKIY